MPDFPQPLRIGMDIGGTHSDGALLEAPAAPGRPYRLLAAAKTRTRPEALLESVRALLAELLQGRDPAQVACLNLSTTLSVNAILTNSIPQAAVLVSAGPGINPETYRVGPCFHRVAGALDHLGRETVPLDKPELDEALNQARKQGIRHFAVVGKFSPRNPEHEEIMAASVRAALPEARISRGHTLSGALNFGRRINTAYFNAAVTDIAQDFVTALRTSLADFGLEAAEVNILGADGGTMPLALSADTPVRTILSGPAASVMGLLAAAPPDEDALLLDIGGTTTDMALLSRGEPLLEREGIALAGRPTLVRALRTRSIGLGGDSAIRVARSDLTGPTQSGQVRVGPLRLGPCMAAGGEHPALMDALNVLGLAAFGDVSASKRGLAELARRAAPDMNAETLSQAALDAALDTLAAAFSAFLAEVNARPLYTIHELLEDRPLAPTGVTLIGGPAEALRDLMGARLGLPARCPAHFAVINAVGAALARSTGTLVLHADTAHARMTISLDRGGQNAEETQDKTAPASTRRVSRDFRPEEAETLARRLLAEDMALRGRPVAEAEIRITQSDAFNMVNDAYRIGRNIRVTAQVQPGVLGRAETPATVAVGMVDTDCSIISGKT